MSFKHIKLWLLTQYDRPLPPRSFVVDGNFTADHLRQKRPQDDVWLLNGQGMITGTHRYQEHLKVAIEKRTVGRPDIYLTLGSPRNHRMLPVSGTLTRLIKRIDHPLPTMPLVLLRWHVQDMAVSRRAQWPTFKKASDR